MRFVARPVRRAIRIIRNPEKEFLRIGTYSFEEVLTRYLTLLVLMGMLSGITRFVISVAKSAYMDMIYNINIQYLRMINYTVGMSTSLVFFYLFSGTFILFLISVLLFAVVRRIKYTRLLMIIFYSASPLLLFGWIPIFIPALILWSCVLFLIGINVHKQQAVNKDVGSIEQRD